MADSAAVPSIDAMNALLRERDAVQRANADFEQFLRAHGVADDDVAAMTKTGPARFMVYRQLIHNRMRNTVREFIERTSARLGGPRLRREFTEFMHERAAKSHYLRDVPAEFVEWAAPRWAADADTPDYLTDLARHELLEYDVRNDPQGADEPTGEPLALDRPLRFDSAARLMSYAHAVHTLSYDIDDREVPEARATRLLVYRDSEHKVRYLELTEFAAAALKTLMLEGQPVAAGLQAACAELGVELDDERLASAATLLADLAERGVMLGAELR